MDRIAAARGAIVCFRFDRVELRRCCTLRRRLAATVFFLIKTRLCEKFVGDSIFSFSLFIHLSPNVLYPDLDPPHKRRHRWLLNFYHSTYIYIFGGGWRGGRGLTADTCLGLHLLRKLIVLDDVIWDNHKLSSAAF